AGVVVLLGPVVHAGAVVAALVGGHEVQAQVLGQEGAVGQVVGPWVRADVVVGVGDGHRPLLCVVWGFGPANRATLHVYGMSGEIIDRDAGEVQGKSVRFPAPNAGRAGWRERAGCGGRYDLAMQ